MMVGILSQIVEFRNGEWQSCFKYQYIFTGMLEKSCAEDRQVQYYLNVNVFDHDSFGIARYR